MNGASAKVRKPCHFGCQKKSWLRLVSVVTGFHVNGRNCVSVCMGPRATRPRWRAKRSYGTPEAARSPRPHLCSWAVESRIALRY